MEVCPTCGGEVEKLVSLGSFQLKGSGWYVTDYKKEGSSPSVEKETSGAGASGDSGAKEGTSGSKPKAEPKGSDKPNN